MAKHDYMEEVFNRSEKQFKNIEEQIGWLSSFEEKTGAYAEDAVKVGGELQRSLEIVNEAESSDSLEKLDDLSSEAEKLKFNKDEPLGIINERIPVVISEKIETSKDIEEVEEIDTRKIKGLKKEKEWKLTNLESIERAKVRDRLAKEVMNTRNISDYEEAVRIVAREKLVIKELGEKKY